MSEPITDVNVNTVVLAVIGGVNSVLLALIGVLGSYYIAKINKGAAVVAEKVAEVKSTLVETTGATNNKLNNIETVGAATHELVNGALTAQMKLTSGALRKAADVTGDPADDEAARLAEKALADHISKQSEHKGLALPEVVKVQLVDSDAKIVGDELK